MHSMQLRQYEIRPDFNSIFLRLTYMLSSVSYICLDVCADMWVVSRGIYLGVLVLSFISLLLF